MSSDNDRCFQCQEVGHLAHYCPNIWCYDCDNYRHVTMDCPDKILPSGTPACHRTDTNDRSRRSSSRCHSHTRHSCHDHRDRSRFSHFRSHPPVTIDTGVVATRTPIEVTPDHSIDLCSALHHQSSSSYCYCHYMPHCRPSSHRNTSRDDSRSLHKSRRQHYRPAKGSSSTSQASSWKHKDKRHKQVTIDYQPSEYYSSDGNESD